MVVKYSCFKLSTSFSRALGLIYPSQKLSISLQYSLFTFDSPVMINFPQAAFCNWVQLPMANTVI